MEVKWKSPDNAISKANSVYVLEWYLTTSSVKVGEVKVKGAQVNITNDKYCSERYITTSSNCI